MDQFVYSLPAVPAVSLPVKVLRHKLLDNLFLSVDTASAGDAAPGVDVSDNVFRQRSRSVTALDMSMEASETITPAALFTTL